MITGFRLPKQCNIDALIREGVGHTPTPPPPPTPLLVRLRIKCHAPHKQKTKDSSANKNHHFIILSPADTVLKQLETFLNIGFLSNP